MHIVMMTISSRGKPYKRELKVLASNVRWRTGRGPATGQGQAIAPTMDALDQPIRQDQPLGKDKPLPLLWTPLTSRFVSLVGAMACPRPASLDALDQPIRQLSRGDGLCSPSFACRFILLISVMFLMLVVLFLFPSLPVRACGVAPSVAY